VVGRANPVYSFKLATALSRRTQAQYRRETTTGPTNMAATWASAAPLVALLTSSLAFGQQTIEPARMSRIGEIDIRFQSYNLEMVEVTGGPFWRPYARQGRADRDLYADRPPIDLSNARLRELTAALAPTYLRISGSWANATYFADGHQNPAKPPPGYNSVLTAAQWRGVIDFARAVGAQIVSSFAVSAGTRDAAGRWMPDEAHRWLAYTHTLGAHLAAAEFINEPNLATQNGAPPGYDGSAYGRDFRGFRQLMRAASPQTLIAGPGNVGESSGQASELSTHDLLAVTGAEIDVLSYHHYYTLSPRCGTHDEPNQAMSEEWLSRTDQTLAYYKALRDELAPAKPIWLTETADAACGGNVWDTSFLDSFRYLDQLGRLAKAGVQVVMHNTLTGSDYGLLDERSFAPRPNYWAALMWHRLMGATVLDPALPTEARLHLYAHCDPARRGGVTVLALNTSLHTPRSLVLARGAERYTLRASPLQSKAVQLNGRTLALGAGNQPPALASAPAPPGAVTFAPASITFLAIPRAANPACR
jgi:hypothetical protein